MSPKRIVAVALLVAVAGCAGFGGGNATTTVSETTGTTAATSDATQSTTEPHTAVGTSHIDRHLSVRTNFGVKNVTVTLAPDGDAATYELGEGDQITLTREIHDRDHDVAVVVERSGEVVFNTTVADYEYYEVVVDENTTRVSSAMV